MTLPPVACVAGLLLLAAVALLPTTLWATRTAPTPAIVYVPIAAPPTACFGNLDMRETGL